MKRIRVQAIIEPDRGSVYTAHRSYYVYLGNRRRIAFSSRREAKAFQAATERFLDETMQEVNALLAQAYYDYRMAWPALHVRNARGVAHAQERMDVDLRAASTAMDRTAAGSDGPNRIYFAWKHLRDANAGVRAVFATLAEWYRYKTQGTWRHQAVIAMRRCDAIEERLRDYGATAAEPVLPHR